MAIIGSTILLSCLLLTALAYKWQIQWKLGLLYGFSIGLIAGCLVFGLHRLLHPLSWTVILPLQVFFILVLTVIGIALRFYRDPERDIPRSKNIIVSPADGTVRYVKPIQKGVIPLSTKKNKTHRLLELTKSDVLRDGAYLVGIEMSVLDIHVNRAPIKGKIIYQQPSKGKFLSLKRMESVLENERVTSVIDNGCYQIGVVQIASRLVRRIVSYLSVGDDVQRGQRIGRITFGSQVDVVVPKLDSLEILVKPGEWIEAGTTILCQHRHEK